MSNTPLVDALTRYLTDECPENKMDDPTNLYEWPRSEAEAITRLLGHLKLTDTAWAALERWSAS